ncbi:hypothetical protein MMC25_006961 [Agyrium rufum]|nr:hypothetical protein [Agyrium rufum]
MRTLWRPLALVSAVLSVCDVASGHSQSRGPLNQLSLVENPTILTPSHRVHYQSRFDIIFNIQGRRQKIKLALEPSEGIIADGASVNYMSADGRIVGSEPINRHEHRIFQGYTWVEMPDKSWTNVGWARVDVRRDGLDPMFEGAMSISGDHHHVQLSSNYRRSKHAHDVDLALGEEERMVIFRDSDFGQPAHNELKRAEEESACGSHKLSFNSDPNHPLFAPSQNPLLSREEKSWSLQGLGSMLRPRQIDTTSGGNSGGVNLTNTIGSTSGCPTTRKVALIGVATDCSYTSTFNSTESARQNVIAQINLVDQVYVSTFNISLGLQNLTVSEAACPGTPPSSAPWNAQCGNITITDRLNTFSEWRGERNDTNAYWTLLTNCRTGAEVGLAWLGQACVNTVTQGNGETVSGANVVARTTTEWQVIAHESGHTFGAVHDCDSQTCGNSQITASQQCCPLSSTSCDAQAQFIMNPSTGNGVTFSPCTVGNICSAFLRNSVNINCLADNKGVSTISGGVCGNGIVEEGEECDCGGAQCGDNQCCDSKTCKFINNAVCDDSNEDCCNSCQFASSGTVCRTSTGSCDPQEVCTGTTSNCPTDTVAPDGQGCGNGLQCASGQCTSRNLQCKTLMGSYTSNNDTYACDDQGCTLSCASPQFGPGTCYSMQQNFLDGTPCGGGGTCGNGQCKGTSTLKEANQWITHNKPLVIGLAVGVGTLILLLITACLVRRCATSRLRSRRGRSSKSAPGMSYGWSGGAASNSSGWIGGGGIAPGGGHGHNPGWGYYNHPPGSDQASKFYAQPTVRYA